MFSVSVSVSTAIFERFLFIFLNVLFFVSELCRFDIVSFFTELSFFCFVASEMKQLKRGVKEVVKSVRRGKKGYAISYSLISSFLSLSHPFSFVLILLLFL